MWETATRQHYSRKALPWPGIANDTVLESLSLASCVLSCELFGQKKTCQRSYAICHWEHDRPYDSDGIQVFNSIERADGVGCVGPRM